MHPDINFTGTIMTKASPAFLQAVQTLIAANEQFAAGEIKSIQLKDIREAQLAIALRTMAADLGVQLREPVQIDSNGEYSVVSVRTDGTSPPWGDAGGVFSAEFCAALNRHNPRCGVAPGAVLVPENGWCRLHHLSAEKMVTEHYARQPRRELSADDESDPAP
jgi:hypothetical protein